MNSVKRSLKKPKVNPTRYWFYSYVFIRPNGFGFGNCVMKVVGRGDPNYFSIKQVTKFINEKEGIAATITNFFRISKKTHNKYIAG
jgi:hypothetical protein